MTPLRVGLYAAHDTTVLPLLLALVPPRQGARQGPSAALCRHEISSSLMRVERFSRLVHGPSAANADGSDDGMNWPPFASNITFELWGPKDPSVVGEKSHFVRVLYNLEVRSGNRFASHALACSGGGVSVSIGCVADGTPTLRLSARAAPGAVMLEGGAGVLAHRLPQHGGAVSPRGFRLGVPPAGGQWRQRRGDGSTGEGRVDQWSCRRRSAGDS